MKHSHIYLSLISLAAFAFAGAARGSVVQRNLSALTTSGTVLVGIDATTGNVGNIVRSTDNGVTFSSVRPATSTPLRNIKASGSTVIAVGDQGFVSRSTDAGLTWSDLNTTAAPAIGPLYDAASNGTLWVAVGQNNYSNVTTEWSGDGGSTWSAPTSIPTAGGTLNSVVYDATQGRWCAVGTDGVFNSTTYTEGPVILTSTDGKAWTAVTPPSGATALNQVATDGSGHLLAVGAAGCLLVSSDGGQSFTVEANSGSVTENLTAVVYSSGSFTAGGQDLVQISYTTSGGSTVSQTPVAGGGDIGTLVVDSSGQVLESGSSFSSIVSASVTLGSLSATYDGTAKSATATTTPSGLTVTLTYDGSGTPPTNAGSYSVSANASGTISGTTYVGTASGTLVIAKASQTISFTGPADQPYSTTPITLSATATSGLTVTFTVSGPATLSGNTLTLTGTGTVVLTADQAGNTNYAPASSVIQSFNVTGGFEAWQAANFTSTELQNSAISGATAVYGQDGLTNLVKYALGLTAKSNATGVTQVTKDATNWIFTYTRPSNITDVTYSVEISTDLTNWTTTGVTHSMASTAGGIDIWQATYPLASASTVFFRLVVTH